MKQDLFMVECVFYISPHTKKIMVTLPTMCELAGTEHYVSSGSWQAGWLAVIQDMLAGASSST